MQSLFGVPGEDANVGVSGEELIIENVEILLEFGQSETNFTVKSPYVGEKRICFLELSFAKSWRSKKSG